MPEETAPDAGKKPAPKDAEAPKAAVKPKEAAEEEKPAAKPKKEKAPAVEDKPFPNFMQEDYLPALKTALEEQGIAGVNLAFEKKSIPVKGFSQYPDCWQVVGRWESNKQPRQFNLYFFDEDINGQKGFSCAEGNGNPSTLESFRIDERKSDLGLLVFWTLQRLNAQKWLVRN